MNQVTSEIMLNIHHTIVSLVIHSQAVDISQDILKPEEKLDNLFFQLIAKRYEHTSTIITTNQPFSKWGDVFSDSMLANAILDRLLHHSHVIKIIGSSY